MKKAFGKLNAVRTPTLAGGAGAASSASSASGRIGLPVQPVVDRHDAATRVFFGVIGAVALSTAVYLIAFGPSYHISRDDDRMFFLVAGICFVVACEMACRVMGWSVFGFCGGSGGGSWFGMSGDADGGGGDGGGD